MTNDHSQKIREAAHVAIGAAEVKADKRTRAEAVARVRCNHPSTHDMIVDVVYQTGRGPITIEGRFSTNPNDPRRVGELLRTWNRDNIAASVPAYYVDGSGTCYECAIDHRRQFEFLLSRGEQERRAFEWRRRRQQFEMACAEAWPANDVAMDRLLLDIVHRRHRERESTNRVRYAVCDRGNSFMANPAARFWFHLTHFKSDTNRFAYLNTSRPADWKRIGSLDPGVGWHRRRLAQDRRITGSIEAFEIVDGAIVAKSSWSPEDHGRNLIKDVAADLGITVDDVKRSLANPGVVVGGVWLIETEYEGKADTSTDAFAEFDGMITSADGMVIDFHRSHGNVKNLHIGNVLVIRRYCDEDGNPIDVFHPDYAKVIQPGNPSDSPDRKSIIGSPNIDDPRTLAGIKAEIQRAKNHATYRTEATANLSADDRKLVKAYVADTENTIAEPDCMKWLSPGYLKGKAPIGRSIPEREKARNPGMKESAEDVHHKPPAWWQGANLTSFIHKSRYWWDGIEDKSRPTVGTSAPSRKKCATCRATVKEAGDLYCRACLRELRGDAAKKINEMIRDAEHVNRSVDGGGGRAELGRAPRIVFEAPVAAGRRKVSGPQCIVCNGAIDSGGIDYFTVWGGRAGRVCMRCDSQCNSSVNGIKTNYTGTAIPGGESPVGASASKTPRGRSGTLWRPKKSDKAEMIANQLMAEAVRLHGPVGESPNFVMARIDPSFAESQGAIDSEAERERARIEKEEGQRERASRRRERDQQADHDGRDDESREFERDDI